MGKKHSKSPSELTEKERRRQQTKIRKQIAQGKKKIRLPNGEILDGKKIRAQRIAGSEKRIYLQKLSQYLGLAATAAVVLRIATARSVPAGSRVLVGVVCIPVGFAFRFLLGALVPLKVDKQQNKLVQESGGNFLNTIMTLALTIEATKFVQFLISVWKERTPNKAQENVAVEGTESTGNGEDHTGEPEMDDDSDWKPPPTVKPIEKLRPATGMTKLFLQGIPFMFGAAIVFMLVIVMLQATSRDPIFGGSNLRVVQTFLSLAISIAGAFVVSTALDFLGSDSLFLHPLYVWFIVCVLFQATLYVSAVCTLPSDRPSKNVLI